MKFTKLFFSLVLMAQTLTSVQAQRIEHKSLVYPFYEYLDATEGEVRNQTQMQVLDSGLLALEYRLDMIRRARYKIEAEYFIWNRDNGGKIMLQALVDAAKRGVKVRILLDKSIAVIKLNGHDATVLKEHGVELRFYNNRRDGKKSWDQFRSHRKLLSIDDREAITGGRNIGDEYFDLSPEFNFHDRDIYVKGRVVKTMVRSFNEYWNHKITEIPAKVERPPEKVWRSVNHPKRGRKKKLVPNTKAIKNYEKLMKQAHEMLENNALLDQMRTRAKEVYDEIMPSKKMHICEKTTFASDLPGGRFSKGIKKGFTDKYRVLRKVFDYKVKNIKSNILISSPYFLHNKETKKLMHYLIKKDVEMTLYTNSLGSTDAVYVAANFYKAVFGWVKNGIDSHIHDGNMFDDYPVFNEEARKAKWGTHSKTHVYDDETIMIGTYNIDNRSNFFNTEMGIFCDGNKELAKEVTDSIAHRIDKGYLILEDGRAKNSEGKIVDVYGDTDSLSKFTMAMIAIPSWLLKFLL